MSAAALETLQNIGRQLDRDIYPVVHDGGFVLPCEAPALETQGEVTHHERQATRASETGSWQWSAGTQGPSSATAPFVSAKLQAQYETELNAVYEAYPKTQVWKQAEGMVLVTNSALLRGLDRAALFIVAIPYIENSFAKGWGFWGVSHIGIEWIGPRHTNFPDGSICAFEPQDGTWKIGDSIVNLLDLYSVWALRHLYMKRVGRWPGYQSIHFAYERMLELRPDEFCGCQRSNKLYGECCQKNDLTLNRLSEAIHFSLNCHGGQRYPPALVTQFALSQRRAPKILDLFRIP